MFDWMAFCSGLTSGMLLTLGFIFLYTRRQFKQIVAKQKQELEAAKDLQDRVAVKLQKVRDIGNKQQELANSILQPSMNAMHSKHKNELMQEHEELEKEKIAILKEVVYKDGIDTDVTVMNPTTHETESMKLSKFLVQLEKQHEEANNLIKESSAKEEVKDILEKLKRIKDKRAGAQSGEKPKQRIVKKETDRGTFYVIERDDDDETIH